jgi:hypothetical protein
MQFIIFNRIEYINNEIAMFIIYDRAIVLIFGLSWTYLSASSAASVKFTIHYALFRAEAEKHQNEFEGNLLHKSLL